MLYQQFDFEFELINIVKVSSLKLHKIIKRITITKMNLKDQPPSTHYGTKKTYKEAEQKR